MHLHCTPSFLVGIKKFSSKIMASKEHRSDALQLLSKDYLQNMLKLLKKNLPNSIRDHHYLFHYLKNYDLIQDPILSSDISVTFKLKFYGTKNSLAENCTYIAITEEEEEDYWIFLSTQEPTATELIYCLENTELINWNAIPIYFSCDEKHLDKVLNILKVKNTEWFIDEPERIYYFPKSKAKLYPRKKIFNSCKIKELKLENAKIIDDYWSHKYAGSLKLIESSIKLNGGLGLFNERNEMLTWMVTNELMSPGFLTVIEAERRKGYATIITKEEFRRFAEKFELDICVRIIVSNILSTNLMQKIGCIPVGTEMWIGRKKV